ncbi:GntR family transcriptional regulator [Deinococcus sp.]|uniref:GntR family transcriptional regulator n=1 Tax=Deinococcus sp. TaxID=47478 RepID=UPI0025DBAE2B|nr:GntR family transcriptional regulator [Deinococcus sp.]
MSANAVISNLSLDGHLKPDAVTQVLREAILRGDFQGGDSLRQEVLAAQLGVSRMPVRDALKQLESEGFVLSVPYQGVVVSHLSAAEVQELGELRLALEPLLLRLAMPRLGKRSFGQAEELLDQADGQSGGARWSELNWAFHAALYTAAQRPRIFGALRTAHLNLDRYMRVMLSSMNHQPTSQEEHRAILAACQERDADLGCELLRQHIAVSSERLLTYLQGLQEAR